MKTDVVLTDRLELRPIALGDLDALHRIRSDPRNCAYLPDGPHADAATTSAWIERFGQRWDMSGLGYWTARLRANGQVLGLGGVDRRAAFWNLYYLVDASFQGRGYATELARAARQAALALDPDLPLVAWIHADNAASQAVARHLGLRDYGLREREHWNGLPMRLWSDREPKPESASQPRSAGRKLGALLYG
jgi:RimJ/RimL family protein N-acetyltransferase